MLDSYIEWFSTAQNPELSYSSPLSYTNYCFVLHSYIHLITDSSLSLTHTHTHIHTFTHIQAENIQSEIQKLRELIDQSESIILINLDSQRNIMLRLSLQLEMGMFSAAFAGLIGMAFGMNLDSSLEEVS